MDINKEKRLEIYRKSSEEQQELYGSVDTGRVLIEAENKLGLVSEDERTLFVLTIGDIILGLHKKESLGQLLRDRFSFSDEKINLAMEGVGEILKKIPDSIASEIEPLPAAPSESITPAVAPAPTVKPLRTFADDVGLSRAHGYGAFRSGEKIEKPDDEPIHRSNQDDIIQK